MGDKAGFAVVHVDVDITANDGTGGTDVGGIQVVSGFAHIADHGVFNSGYAIRVSLDTDRAQEEVGVEADGSADSVGIVIPAAVFGTFSITGGTHVGGFVPIPSIITSGAFSVFVGHAVGDHFITFLDVPKISGFAGGGLLGADLDGQDCGSDKAG